MKYFLDTEFLEGEQTIYQWGLKTDTWLRIASIGFLALGVYVFFFIGGLMPLYFVFPAIILAGISLPKTPNTIDLISIGIVSEEHNCECCEQDGTHLTQDSSKGLHCDKSKLPLNSREYYAISKDFNLREAWNRYELKTNVEFHYMGHGNSQYSSEKKIKVYWIRENVLKPIFKELYDKSINDTDYVKSHFYTVGDSFSYRHLKSLINWYGLTNKQIEREILQFTLDPTGEGYDDWLGTLDGYVKALKESGTEKPEFYAYYADYDWVAFCWLFGKMIDLPKSFPMYCKDLKQFFDEKVKVFCELEIKSTSFDSALKRLKDKHPNYPKQENEHNALADAKWNLKLYKFLKSL